MCAVENWWGYVWVCGFTACCISVLLQQNHFLKQIVFLLHMPAFYNQTKFLVSETWIKVCWRTSWIKTSGCLWIHKHICHKETDYCCHNSKGVFSTDVQAILTSLLLHKFAGFICPSIKFCKNARNCKAYIWDFISSTTTK